jgi:PAS domain S-box-containing protein
MGKNAPLFPENELKRLEILKQYQILDTLPERQFDDLSHLASIICQIPVSYISLVDQHRQWFKSKKGFDLLETPRDISFCAHTILQPDVMVIEDATLDPRFCDNPLVTGPPFIRFYAGAPIIVQEGVALGTLCVIDYKTNKLSSDQKEALKSLARQVADQLELRKVNRTLDFQNQTLKSTHHELKTVQHFLSNVLDNLPISVFCKDIQNDFRFNLMNKQALEMWGFTLDQVIGKNTHDIFPKEQADIFHQQDLQVLKKNKTLTSPNETVHIPKIGRRFLHTTKLILSDHSGHPRYLLGISADITDIKDAQLKLLNSSKMSSLGEMAAGIAHEINNPLAVVRSRSQLIRNNIKNGQNDLEYILSSAEKIDEITVRISKVISGLRAFARDGKDDPFIKTSFHVVISDALELCQSRLKSNGVELRLQTELDPSLTIECRPVQVTQIILNLLNNAFDAIRDLEEKWVDLSAKEFTDYIELSVTDAGHGIPSEIAEKIMHPFFTTKEAGKGTGLGLSISKGMAESHGGSLTLDKDCKNTRFELRLPKSHNEKNG